MADAEAAVPLRRHGWRWQGDERGGLPEVLRGSGHEELVSCSIGTSEAQAVDIEDVLQVCEQHLDPLPPAPGDEIGIGRRDLTCHVGVLASPDQRAS